MATVLGTVYDDPPLQLVTQESLLVSQHLDLPALSTQMPCHHNHRLISLKTFVDSAGSTTVLTLSPLSPASQYHLDLLLAYSEVELTSSSTTKLPSTVSQSPSLF